MDSCLNLLPLILKKYSINTIETIRNCVVSTSTNRNEIWMDKSNNKTPEYRTF